MKKGCAILSLLILFYTQIGYFWQFMIYQQVLREKVREAWLSTLPDAQLRRLSLDEVNASGRWQDGGRECWFNEHLYDVIRQRKVGGKTYLFCLDDQGEARLIKKSGETKPIPGIPGKMGFVFLSQYPDGNIPPPAPFFDRGGSLPCNVLSQGYREMVFPPPRA